MITIHQKADPDDTHRVDDITELDHVQREKGRLKVKSRGGEEVRIFLERGKLLQRGDLLLGDCGRLVQVELAKEPVIHATTDNWMTFSQAAYHLGNRHVRLQLGDRWLRFLEDSVLIELMEHLGLECRKELAEFEPETGAYGHGHAGKPAAHHHS